MLTDFLAIPSRENLWTLLLIYIGIGSVLLWIQWRAKESVGLPLIYAFALTVIHAIAAYIYTLDYTPKSTILEHSGVSLKTTHLGFRVATFGFFSYVIGVLICPLIFRKKPQPKSYLKCPQMTTQLPGTLLIISLLSFFFVGPIFKRIPSLGSMGTAGAAMSVVALFIYIWTAYHTNDRKRFLLGLAGTVAFPALTILFMGFAGYGANAAAMVWVGVLRFYRPRILSLIFLVGAMYMGLTGYVNWMMEREQIRASVWGNHSLEDRIERTYQLVDKFEFLDTQKQLHLEIIDLRLNQNDIVGKAFNYLKQGRAEFANGYTLYVAAIAWIPRILWPDKPKTGGSGGVVSHFTGQKFAEGTSVGAGQPLEFYVNFGWPGVFFGFVLLGLLIRYIDGIAGFHLARGDLWTCARWMLPGIGLIQPGGIMAEEVGSFAAFSVFAWGLHQLFFSRYYENSPPPPRGNAVPNKAPDVRRQYS